MAGENAILKSIVKYNNNSFLSHVLAIAAMEDIGLLPKPTPETPVHRPTVPETFGQHHIPPGGYMSSCNV